MAVESRARAQALQDQGAEREPQAGAAFRKGFAQTVSSVSVDVPLAQVSLLRTTNLLERFHRETRRKQRAIGMFPSEAGGEVVWSMMARRETAKQRAACRGRV